MPKGFELGGVKEGAFEILDTSGLNIEQKNLLKDYMKPHEGQKYYGERAKFMIDFLKHPEEFEVTDFAKCSAFCEFVLTTYDKKFATPGDVKVGEIDPERLRNIKVEVTYGYSSILGRDSAVQVIRAESRKSLDSQWESRRRGGVFFSLEDWVQRKPKQEEK